MENRLVSLLILTVSMLCCTGRNLATVNRCQDCGHTPVPYPLSTSPDCGNQHYKVRCHAGSLWFDALNSSSYLITSINPLTRRLIIRPPGLANNVTCMSADFKSQGLILDDNLPFNITSSNTVIGMNCSYEMLTLSKTAHQIAYAMTTLSTTQWLPPLAGASRFVVYSRLVGLPMPTKLGL
ncbi:hypothetical protein ACFX12_009802 [Malus domestica]